MLQRWLSSCRVSKEIMVFILKCSESMKMKVKFSFETPETNYQTKRLHIPGSGKPKTFSSGTTKKILWPRRLFVYTWSQGWRSTQLFRPFAEQNGSRQLTFECLTNLIQFWAKQILINVSWYKSWKWKENQMIVNSLDKDWLTYTDSYEVFNCSSSSAAYNFMIIIFCQWKFMKLWRVKASNTFCNPRYYFRLKAQRKTSKAPCALMTCLYHFVSNILVQYNDFQLLKPFW